ncbi:MAG: PEP-CTERM sorting domain-containing protein [Planctomycetota bacterium]
MLRYDDNGNFIRSEVAAGTGGLDGANGMAIVGNELLVSSQNTGSILRFDASDGSSLGTFAGGIGGPTQLFDTGSSVLTGSFTGTAIAEYANDGTSLGDFTSGGSLDGIASYVFGTNGDLYVGDFNGGEVEVFDGTTGAFQSVFATSLGSGITGLAFDDSGNLWLSSLFTHEVIQLDSSGSELTRFSTGGPIPAIDYDGSFPSDIVINPDGSGELLIGLTGNAGVFRFDTSGNNLGEFTTGDGGALIVPGEILQVSAVPEPTHAAILAGLLIFGGASRRRKI